MKTLETRAAFARRMGVNRSHITRAMQADRLVMVGKLVDVHASIARMQSTESPTPHHESNRARIADEKTARPAPGATITDTPPPTAKEATASVGLRLRTATANEREAKAEIAAMERDKMAGLLVLRSDVEFVLRDLGQALGRLLNNLPSQLAPVLAAHRGDVPSIHTSLQEAARDIQHEIASTMQRQMEAVE